MQQPWAHLTDLANWAASCGGWDVWTARIVSRRGRSIVISTGGWNEGSPVAALGSHGILRRLSPEGIAEWEGTIVPAPPSVHPSQPTPFPGGPPETLLTFRLTPGTAAGRLFQRRRSPRIAVRLRPVRLIPLPSRLASAPQPDPDIPGPVARLADVSTHGAAIVIDCPLASGTTVALEFDLPGERDPFLVRGRVVEPDGPLHAKAQPQPDGLPGFRRGVEFIGRKTNREARRLDDALSRLLAHATAPPAHG